MLYHQLLRAELLGVPVAPASPDRGGGGGENGRGFASPASSPAKKMFRYKSGDRCAFGLKPDIVGQAGALVGLDWDCKTLDDKPPRVDFGVDLSAQASRW